eukprot:3454637-Rhodomonas_salina.1
MGAPAVYCLAATTPKLLSYQQSLDKFLVSSWQVLVVSLPVWSVLLKFGKVGKMTTRTNRGSPMGAIARERPYRSTGYQKCTALPVLAYSEKKFNYLNTEILDPPDLQESTELQLPVSTGKWNLRSLLDINFSYPKTLLDIGLSARTKGLSSAIRHWSEVGGVTHSPSPQAVDADVPTSSAHAWRDDLTSGPFEDPEDNALWCSRVLAGATDADYLSTVDALGAIAPARGRPAAARTAGTRTGPLLP